MHSELLQTKQELIFLKRKLQAQPIKNWYVFYTCPRAEKIVYNELISRDYEVFLPIKKTLKLWMNRQMKCVEEVLFPNYIFVNTQKSELYSIIKIFKVVAYIRCGETPSTIASKEIEGLKKMLNLEQNIFVETDFSIGQKVRVVQGPLAGHEGILIKQKKKTRFGIQLREINQMVSIEICANVLEKI